MDSNLSFTPDAQQELTRRAVVGAASPYELYLAERRPGVPWTEVSQAVAGDVTTPFTVLTGDLSPADSWILLAVVGSAQEKGRVGPKAPVGRRISRQEALKISMETLEKAESDRLQLAAQEAARGAQWEDER